MTIRKTSLAVLVSLAAVACGEDRPAQSPSNEPATMTQGQQTTAPTATATHTAEPVATTTATQEPTPPPPPAETISDAQIVLIGTTLDQGEVDHGKLAQQKATHAEVKAFAAMMVKDHGDAMKKKNDLAQKLSLTPADSTHSTQMKSDAQQMATELQGLKGKDFDAKYIDGQVKMHQHALDMIDQKLLPAAKNADLRSDLETARSKIADHLKKAQEIQAKLSGQPGSTKGGMSPTTDHSQHHGTGTQQGGTRGTGTQQQGGQNPPKKP